MRNVCINNNSVISGITAGTSGMAGTGDITELFSAISKVICDQI